MKNYINSKLRINNDYIDYIEESLCLHEDAKRKIVTISFDLDTNVQNIELAKTLKIDQNGHQIVISSSELNITVTHAILSNDYAVKLGEHGAMHLIFEGIIK